MSAEVSGRPALSSAAVRFNSRSTRSTRSGYGGGRDGACLPSSAVPGSGLKLAVTAYVVAAVVAVGGTVADTALIVNGALDYVDTVEGFERVPVGMEGTVTLEGTGGYTVYFEAEGVDGGTTPTVPV